MGFRVRPCLKRKIKRKKRKKKGSEREKEKQGKTERAGRGGEVSYRRRNGLKETPAKDGQQPVGTVRRFRAQMGQGTLKTLLQVPDFFFFSPGVL